MNEFNFNLQRFNEDGGDGTTTQADSTSQSTDNSADQLPRIAVKDGQLVFLDNDDELGYNGDEGSQEDADNDDSADNSEADGQEETDQSGNETGEQKYIVSVRGEKVEVGLDELLGGYMRTADYTRSKQDLKAHEDRLQALYGRQPEVAQNTQQTQAPQADRKAEYLQLKSKVEARVQEITGEPYNSMDDDHLAIFTQEMADERMNLAQNRTKQTVFQHTLMRHAQEPDWNEIDQFAGQVMKHLPKGVGDEIESQIREGNAEVLDQFLSLVKQEYRKSNNPTAYAKPPVPQIPKKIVKEIPPRVESAGTGADANVVTSQFDGRKFGEMKNIYNKMDYLEKMGVFGAMQNIK